MGSNKRSWETNCAFLLLEARVETVINIKNNIQHGRAPTLQRLFYGYSTVETNVKNQQFADIELVKRDLLNAFYTRPGERVMMPEYGCAIWNMLYDPFDDITQQNIVDEVQKVIDGDPRVQANSIAVNAFDQGIRLQMDLFYVPFNAIGTFSLDFDRRTAESY